MKKGSTERSNTPSVRRDIALFGNMRVMTCAGLLVALSIVLGKFLQIPNPFQDIIRISFENTPLIMSGIFFGPCVGLVTGAVADLLGCAEWLLNDEASAFVTGATIPVDGGFLTLGGV